MNSKAFNYIHDSITLALQKAPREVGDVTPMQLVITVVSIAASMASVFKLDFVGIASSVIVNVEPNEANAVSTLRKAYECKRGIATRKPS